MKKLADSYSRTYRIWHGMKTRCLNPNAPDYHRYGGRGIKVCEKWMRWVGFKEDMGWAPDGLTLDRIDNDGNYEKENCRWATMSTQIRNSRKAFMIEFNGERLNLCEWASRTGLHRACISARIKAGWPPELALTTPSMNGRERALSRWAKHRATKP